MADGEELIDNEYDEEEDEELKPFNERCHDKMETVTEYMRFYRQRNGLTQSKMADTIHISVSYLNKIENNKCKVPAYVVYLYCQTLHVPMDELFSLINTEANKSTLVQIRHELPHLPQEVLDTIQSIIEVYEGKDNIEAKAEEDRKKREERKAKREQKKSQDK